MVPTCRAVESAVRVNPARQKTPITFNPNGRPSGARRTRPVRPQAVETWPVVTASTTASGSATMVPTCRAVESVARANPARRKTPITFDPNGRPSGARRTRPVRPQAVETWPVVTASTTASDSATMVPTCRAVESAVRANPARRKTPITFDPNGRPSGARQTRPVRPQAAETVVHSSPGTSLLRRLASTASSAVPKRADCRPESCSISCPPRSGDPKD